MTAAIPDEARTTRDPRTWPTVAAMTFLAGAMRFGGLGRQSPWLDEITNWQLTVERGPEFGGSVHWLTHLFQWVGLRVSDSDWGLRLYAAVFGTLAVGVFTLWLIRRAGHVAAIAGGVILAFSPFQIFYSQDANHYAMVLLAAPLTLLVGDSCFLRRGGARSLFPMLVVAYVLAGGIHPTMFSVPLTLLILACITIRADVKSGAIRLTPAGKSTLLFTGLVVAAVGFGALYFLTGKLWNSPATGGRLFGLNWPFLSATLQSFYGGIYRPEKIDILIVAAGIVLTCAGLAKALRTPALKNSALIILIFAACILGPFVIFQPRQYFSPRYIASLSVLLVAPIAFLFFKSTAHPRRIAGVMHIVAALWIILFCARSISWQRERMEGSFQPSREVLVWIERNTPSNATIVTRHPYSSLGVNFLWERSSMQGRSLNALTYMDRSGAISIQQIRELKRGSNGPIYFVSLIEDEDFRARDFKAWITANSESVARFDSNATDAFVPIDWGITIRKIKPLTDNCLELPRAGDAPSDVFPEKQFRITNATLFVPHGGVVSYNFSAAENLEGIAIDMGGENLPANAKVTAVIDDKFFAIRAPSNERTTYVVPEPVLPGNHTLEIQFPLTAGKSQSSRAALSIHEVFAYASDSTTSETITFSRMTELDSWALGLKDVADFCEKARTRLSLKLPVAVKLNPGSDYFVVQRYDVRGLGPIGLRAELKSPNGSTMALWPAVNWTFAPMTMTAFIPANVPADSKLTLGVVRSNSYHPRRAHAILGPIAVYAGQPDQ